MKQNTEVKSEKVLSLKGYKNYAEIHLGQERIFYINLVEKRGLSIKTTDVWHKIFDKIELYTSLVEPNIGLSASFNGVLNNTETLKLVWQLQEGQLLVNMLNRWLKKNLTNTIESTDDEVTENSIPPEYDVKVGDVVEITKYCTGNKIGELVTVVEVFNVSSLNNGDKYNTVRVINQEGKKFYEGDVKLSSRHVRKK